MHTRVLSSFALDYDSVQYGVLYSRQPTLHPLGQPCPCGRPIWDPKCKQPDERILDVAFGVFTVCKKIATSPRNDHHVEVCKERCIAKRNTIYSDRKNLLQCNIERWPELAGCHRLRNSV